MLILAKVVPLALNLVLLIVAIRELRHAKAHERYFEQAMQIGTAALTMAILIGFVITNLGSGALTLLAAITAISFLRAAYLVAFAVWAAGFRGFWNVFALQSLAALSVVFFFVVRS